MATSLRVRFFAAFLILLAVRGTALAQQQPPQRPAGAPAAAPVHASLASAPCNVAIIDLAYILKKHAGFQQRMEELRHEAETVENEIKGKRDAIQKLAQRLDDYTKGSPDYKNLEEDITKRQADLGVDFNIAKKKFQEAEARVYYEAYQQVLAEVRKHAEATGISLVMKFDGDEANKDNPDDVRRDLYKLVLYYNQAIDITPVILDRLKGQVPRPAGPNPATMRPGVPPAPRR
ncbi:MAG: OmpH family outer membrane protein [Planctomycetia bacterium]|nr:OmpH family outer membrane protein [Planctomycetia bacterium]